MEIQRKQLEFVPYLGHIDLQLSHFSIRFLIYYTKIIITQALYS